MTPNRKLTEEEREAVAIESNREDGKWEWDMLANFSEDLLKDVGFPSEELDKIFSLQSDEDDFNPEQEYENIKKTKVKLGKIY